MIRDAIQSRYQEQIAAESRRRQRASRLREVADALAKIMRCNCDLDNWEPEPDTGHSWVCRIHKAAKLEVGNGRTET